MVGNYCTVIIVLGTIDVDDVAIRVNGFLLFCFLLSLAAGALFIIILEYYYFFFIFILLQ